MDVQLLPFAIYGVGIQESQCNIERIEGHMFHQLIFSLEGQGQLIVKNEMKKVGENQLIYLQDNEYHKYYADIENADNWKTGWIAFRGNAISDTLKGIGISQSFVCDISPLIIKKFEQILRLYEGKDPFKIQLMSVQLYDLLVTLIQMQEKKITKKTRENGIQFSRVIEFMEENYQKDVSLEEFAEIMHVSPPYFCKIFKMAIKMTPIEYIQMLRIESAKRMLLQTNLKVKDIANAVGYKDSSYFSLIFKKREGISARRYRGY